MGHLVTNEHSVLNHCCLAMILLLSQCGCALLGEECTRNSDCVIDHSVCTMDICSCEANYMPTDSVFKDDVTDSTNVRDNSENSDIAVVIGLAYLVYILVLLLFVLLGCIVQQSYQCLPQSGFGSLSSSINKQVRLDGTTDVAFELDTFRFDYKDLKQSTKILGTGQFGVVRKGVLKTDRIKKATVAFKIINDTTSFNQELHELQVLRRVGFHPNVVQLYGYCNHKETVYVAMEYMSRGDLESYLQKEPTLTQHDILQFALDVANGMAYLASKQIIHRDLAARNILIDAKQTAKVADFGLARIDYVYFKISKGILPFKWMAIESLKEGKYTTKSDVWSFGVVLWELTSAGATPYPSLTGGEVIEKVKNGYRLPKPEKCGKELYAVMCSCWNLDETQRPAFEKLITRLQDIRYSNGGYAAGEDD